MKKYIEYILIFFVFVIAIDICIGIVGDYMLHNLKPGQSKQFDDLCLNDRHDVLIMGSSRARHHYVPHILEDSLHLDVYNAGYDGNGIILSYGILQMILERYNKPQYIIYDINPAFDICVYEPDNNRTRYLSMLKPYIDHDSVKKIMKDVSIKTYYSSLSGMYRYNSYLITFMKEYLIGSTVFDKGYVPLHGELKTNTDNNTHDKWTIDTVKVKYLHLFIECCKDNDIKLILALSPKYGISGDNTQNYIHDLACHYDIPVIDEYTNPYYQSNATLFKDKTHLNNIGAIDYSRLVCAFLNMNL